MNDIKVVIANLCKFVNLIVDVNFKADYVRLAKFNKNDNHVVSKFWHLLSQFTTDLNERNCNTVEKVKLFFAYLKYKNVNFYALPEDMSFGSRELLIAFAWLIAEHSVLETKMQGKIASSSLGKEFPSFNEMNMYRKNNSISKNFKNQTDYLNYALWMVGRINTNIKTISECSKKTCRIIKKIHIDSRNVSGLPHLSVNEVAAIKNSRLLQIYLMNVEPIVELFDLHEKWKRKSHLFWEWMETVLNAKDIDFNAKDCKDEIQPNTINTFSNLLGNELKTVIITPENDAAEVSLTTSQGISYKVQKTLPRHILQSSKVVNELQNMSKCEPNTKQVYLKNELEKIIDDKIIDMRSQFAFLK